MRPCVPFCFCYRQGLNVYFTSLAETISFNWSAQENTEMMQALCIYCSTFFFLVPVHYLHGDATRGIGVIYSAMLEYCIHIITVGSEF